ncbi:MAG TPA: hypothetical protein VEF89_18035 [Solirubrobacteraceae bacterium]|nr:hypothetical protein [Solirubrobacteraceae bacterium]
MTPLPIASFLAGSLLTILVPLGVLIAISVWYVRLVRRVPDPGLSSRADAVPEAAVALPDPPVRSEGAGEGGQRAT